VKLNTDAKFTGLSGAVCEGGAPISLTPVTPGGVFTTSSGTIAGTNYTPGNAGMQLVKYVIKDSFCPDSTTQTIKINALPKFSLGKDTTICDGSTTDLLIPVAGNVLWDDGSNTNPRTISNGGKYYAEVDNNGCKWSDTINISEKTTPQVTLPGDTLICKGSLLQLTASWPGATTTWSTGYTGNSIYVANSGIYTVTVTNACGFATDQIEVTLASGFCDVFIPDAFTPNGDGRNDSFEIIGRDVNAVFLNIYNRWGELIWENHNHLTGWDGKRLNGKDIEEGIYTWKIILKSPYKDERKVFTGHVTLLR
jgi:gliding motility-associated-like protein